MPFYICQTPDCSPLAPMVGTIVKRRYFDDMTEYRCRSCKVSYDAKILGTDICPKCGKMMIHPKLWSLECPKCKRLY